MPTLDTAKFKEISNTNTAAFDSSNLKHAVTAVGETVISTTDTATEAKKAEEKTTKAAALTLSKQYATENGRLVNFEYTSGFDDNQRRACLHLTGSSDAINNLIKDTPNTTMKAIIEDLQSTSGFTSFILTSLTENFQEKQSIVQTVNDYFISTFCGQDPQIIQITGILPFDAASATSSWFINFANAYKFIFRASILAKYKLQLYLYLPDFSAYRCYPVSFTSGIQSTQDNLIQFQMNAIVVQEDIKSAKGLVASASSSESSSDSKSDDKTDGKGLSEKVEENTNDTKNKETTGENQTPKEVGKKNFLEKTLEATTDFINTVQTGQGTNDLAKAINKVNKIVSKAKQVQGILNTTGQILGIRNKIKILS